MQTTSFSRILFSILLLLLSLPLFDGDCESAETFEAIQPRIWTQQKVYGEYEPIVVNFKGFPGYEWDWITIVESSAKPKQFNDFFYTGKKSSGTLEFRGFPEGRYQVRAFFKWPDGNYKVKTIYPFEVKKAAAAGQEPVKRLAWTRKRIYEAGEMIIVDFKNMPGNGKDMITVVPANSPEDTLHQWYYLRNNREGTATFKGLDAGEYEVRVYFDWPESGYDIRDRYLFTVKEKSPK